jgi:DNA-binding MarR family transcriptional regulator
LGSGRRGPAPAAGDGLADLRFTDGFVFQQLVGGPVTIGALAEPLGVSQQAASKSVADLERRGYVARSRDPGDARALRVALPSAARPRSRAATATVPRSPAAMIEAIRRELRARANPGKAEDMRAYMKSEMPLLGVQKPRRTEIARAVFAAHPLDGFEAWRDTVLRLWREATYREELIVAGAWWDFVHEVAVRLVGDLYGVQRCRADARRRRRTSTAAESPKARRCPAQWSCDDY